MRRMFAAVAVLGINIGLVRAYALAEMAGQHLDEVNFGFFTFFTLQLGFWFYLRTTGRHRRFWLGFEVSGLAATMAIAFLVLFDASPFKGLVAWYENAMGDLAYHYLPPEVDSFLENDHFTLWMAIVCFLPEFLAACLGGVIATCLYRKTKALEPASGTPPGHSALPGT